MVAGSNFEPGRDEEVYGAPISQIGEGGLRDYECSKGLEGEN